MQTLSPLPQNWRLPVSVCIIGEGTSCISLEKLERMYIYVSTTQRPTFVMSSFVLHCMRSSVCKQDLEALIGRVQKNSRGGKSPWIVETVYSKHCLKAVKPKFSYWFQIILNDSITKAFQWLMQCLIGKEIFQLSSEMM